MAKLLDNYIFNDRMRYEAHHLVYSYSEEDEPILIGGFLGAAYMLVLLINSDEGERRNIPLDIENERNRDLIFKRYEQEVIADDWGYLRAELNQLNDAYIQLNVSEKDIYDICPNQRQLSIAMRMLNAYMQGLVVEEFGEHIWEASPWKMPFAQWLFDAGDMEAYRQQFLDRDWSDPIVANLLAEWPKLDVHPTFLFNGEDVEAIMRRYWGWLWDVARQQVAVTPDAEQQLEEVRALIRKHETDYRFLEDDLKELPIDSQKLFRKWMTRWTAFVTDQLASTALDSFPEQPHRRQSEQVLFPDTTLTCPEQNKYTQVRDYILDRCRYDDAFRDYYQSHHLNDFCDQLTRMFGWYVNPNSLGKSLKRKKK